MQVIKFKKLHEDAQLPVYSTEGAGGFDISASSKPESASACRWWKPNTDNEEHFKL